MDGVAPAQLMSLTDTINAAQLVRDSLEDLALLAPEHAEPLARIEASLSDGTLSPAALSRLAADVRQCDEGGSEVASLLHEALGETAPTVHAITRKLNRGVWFSDAAAGRGCSRGTRTTQRAAPSSDGSRTPDYERACKLQKRRDDREPSTRVC